MMIDASLSSMPSITFHITQPVVENQNSRSPALASKWKCTYFNWSRSIPPCEWTIGFGNPVVPDEYTTQSGWSDGTRSNSRAKATENQVGVLLASFDRSVSADPNVRFAEELEPDDQGPRRYLVARGESLAVIADRHGIELTTLLEANPDLQAQRVVAGQWLEIPARATTE